MDRKTIIAVALAALILFGYQFYISKHYPDAYNFTPAVSTNDVRENSPDQARSQKPALTMPENKYPLYKPSFEELADAGREITVETDKYIVTLSNIGGCINQIDLKEYPDPLTNNPLRLVDIKTPEEGIFNIEGFNDEQLSRLIYEADKAGHEVTFKADLSNGVQIKKKYNFHNSSNDIELSIYVFNPTETALTQAYSMVAASNIDIPTRLDRRYAQIVSEISGKPRRDNGKKGEGAYIEGYVTYAGLQNKYFSVITKPSAASTGLRMIQTIDDNLISIIEIGQFTLEPNTGASHNYILYVGPSKRNLLKQYKLESAASYGFFGGISQVLVSGLALFQRIFRNWGIAIILLSALVNLILFPLSRKSYESMKKMQEIQPHMEKLRNEHKDNPTRLNKEMMDLYKKYNVNPMGGCLPLFLQIPVFIALYQGLMRSIELRGAKFLWIKDLSMPDAVPLPVSLPMIGNSVNILPVLMAGAMVFQQRLSMRKGAAESAQAKQQQQMMVLMPVIFLFIMYSFPSGLVLYWLTNTLLTMFEQRAIMRS